jgi:hypothetical protein
MTYGVSGAVSPASAEHVSSIALHVPRCVAELSRIGSSGAAARRRVRRSSRRALALGGPAQRDRAVLRSVGTADLAAAFVVAFAGSRPPSCRCRLSINSRLAMSVPPGRVTARSAASSMDPATSSHGLRGSEKDGPGRTCKKTSNVMSKASICGQDGRIRERAARTLEESWATQSQRGACHVQPERV